MPKDFIQSTSLESYLKLQWVYSNTSTIIICTLHVSNINTDCFGEYFSGCPVTYFKCMRSFVLASTRFFAFLPVHHSFWSKQDEIKLLMFCLFSRGFYGLSTDQLSWRALTVYNCSTSCFIPLLGQITIIVIQ